MKRGVIICLFALCVSCSTVPVKQEVESIDRAIASHVLSPSLHDTTSISAEKKRIIDTLAEAKALIVTQDAKIQWLNKQIGYEKKWAKVRKYGFGLIVIILFCSIVGFSMKILSRFK